MNAPAQTKLSKLNRRLSEGGIGALPGWAAQWLYWNGKLYRIPALQNARAGYKHRKQNKKFGIAYPVVIYQMGKVGSSSLYQSFLALDLDVPVHHIHCLAHLDEYEAHVRATRLDPTDDLQAITEGRALRREIDAGQWEGWYLITPVRSPIPRAISEFFENLDAHVPDFSARFQRGIVTADELADYFLHHFTDSAPQTWFDDQVRDLCGLDVYATPFPVARGYEIYRRLPYALAVLRVEDLNTRGADIMRELMGLDNFHLLNRNLAERKPYAALYRQFIENIKFPSEWIAAMHSTRYARHFYTPDELAASAARWTA